MTKEDFLKFATGFENRDVTSQTIEDLATLLELMYLKGKQAKQEYTMDKTLELLNKTRDERIKNEGRS